MLSRKLCEVTCASFFFFWNASKRIFLLVMTNAKKRCVHPMRHLSGTKIGQRLSHSVGHHSIPGQLARTMQKQNRRSIGMSKIRIKEGDLLCKVWFYCERDRLDSLLSVSKDDMEINDHVLPHNEHGDDTCDYGCSKIMRTNFE